MIKPHVKGGYQDIFLPASITCRLAPAAGNLRLLDSAGAEVPYILNESKLVEEEAAIVWLPRYEDDYWTRWYSRSYFQNPKQLVLDRLAVKIRNADVHQDFWLSGSDDMHRWYIIREDYDYNGSYDPNSTWNLMTIHFPPTDYKYYKLELRHHWREPIQIMGAGYYAFAEKKGNSQAIPEPVITQREEGSQSFVNLHFDGPHYLDQFLLEVDGPELYMRSARLEKKTDGGQYITLQRFQLSSKMLNQLSLDHERGSDWRLVIENKDDKPIQIAGVQARQRQLFLTAKLLPKAKYKLMVADENLRAPEYDLGYFKQDLPALRSVASTGEPMDLRKPVAASLPIPSRDTVAAQPQAGVVVPEKPLFQQPVFLWGGIGLIVLLVGGMSLKLLKEMKKEGN